MTRWPKRSHVPGRELDRMAEQALERKQSGSTGDAMSSQKFRYNSIQLALAFVISAQLFLVFFQPINWDEFYHISKVHEAHNGTLVQSLQLLHVRIFAWLPLLPLDTIDQLRIARLFMLACELFTAWAIAGIARKFVSPHAAALAALAWISGGYVFRHGFSFRADPMAAALLMGALWLLLAARFRPLIIVGIAALLSLAALTTIKIILYAPAFAGIAWLRWREAEDRTAVFRAFALIALLTAIGAAILLALTIASIPPEANNSGQRTLRNSADFMFSRDFSPNGAMPLCRSR